MRLFDFDMKHIVGKKHGGPDTLSRRGRYLEDSEESDPEDLEDTMDADLMMVSARDMSA